MVALPEPSSSVLSVVAPVVGPSVTGASVTGPSVTGASVPFVGESVSVGASVVTTGTSGSVVTSVSGVAGVDASLWMQQGTE